MAGIELLRALAAHRDPGVEVTGLDAARTLRFVIEFESEVDLASKREEIGSRIGIDDFQFFPLLETTSLDPEFGEFYVLQFPGLERTVDRPALFSMAHELQEILEAVTVEPELGTNFYREPLAPDALPEGFLTDLFQGLCFVPGDAPPDLTWALERAGVLAAWNATAARGDGIRIAQPDTGVTQHVELSDVAMSDGYNVLTDTADPTDPLSSGGNPGHGTGTASVMTSGPTGSVLGSAPEVTLVPIRCVESVILTFNGGAVAKAVDHARRNGCHVVTMSLGGTPSRALRKAIRQAIRADMIVLAAAGNCVELVVYPARYDEVIAVAGSNVDDGTWRGSCHGPAVDVTRPVRRCGRPSPGRAAAPSEAAKAPRSRWPSPQASAALWLSHHGRPAVSRRRDSGRCRCTRSSKKC